MLCYGPGWTAASDRVPWRVVGFLGGMELQSTRLSTGLYSGFYAETFFTEMGSRNKGTREAWCSSQVSNFKSWSTLVLFVLLEGNCICIINIQQTTKRQIDHRWASINYSFPLSRSPHYVMSRPSSSTGDSAKHIRINPMSNHNNLPSSPVRKPDDFHPGQRSAQ